MLAPQQCLMPAQALQPLHTPHWCQLSRMRATRDAFNSECQGKGYSIPHGVCRPVPVGLVWQEQGCSRGSGLPC